MVVVHACIRVAIVRVVSVSLPPLALPWHLEPTEGRGSAAAARLLDDNRSNPCSVTQKSCKGQISFVSFFSLSCWKVHCMCNSNSQSSGSNNYTACSHVAQPLTHSCYYFVFPSYIDYWPGRLISSTSSSSSSSERSYPYLLPLRGTCTA